MVYSCIGIDELYRSRSTRAIRGSKRSDYNQLLRWITHEPRSTVQCVLPEGAGSYENNPKIYPGNRWHTFRMSGYTLF